MDLHPIILGPTTPPDLLWFLIHSCAYPTTVIVCSSRDDFLTSLTASLVSHTKFQAHQLKQEASDDQDETQSDRYSLLGTAPLYQMAIAKHLRIVFIPTVSHLRAYLSVFSTEDSPVPPPPSTLTTVDAGEVLYGRDRAPLLLIYGFLELHRHTSEWTIVGLSNSASILMETAKRTGFKALVTELKPDTHGEPPFNGSENDIKAEDEDEKKQQQHIFEHEDVLLQSVPFTRDSSIRIDLTGTGLGQRTVKVRNILERWFRFREDGLGEGMRL
ncbi:hypothetical protein V8F06_012710 [Rhypophila decipiens]